MLLTDADLAFLENLLISDGKRNQLRELYRLKEQYTTDPNLSEFERKERIAHLDEQINVVQRYNPKWNWAAFWSVGLWAFSHGIWLEMFGEIWGWKPLRRIFTLDFLDDDWKDTLVNAGPIVLVLALWVTVVLLRSPAAAFVAVVGNILYVMFMCSFKGEEVYFAKYRKFTDGTRLKDLVWMEPKFASLSGGEEDKSHGPAVSATRGREDTEALLFAERRRKSERFNATKDFSKFVKGRNVVILSAAVVVLALIVYTFLPVKIFSVKNPSLDGRWHGKTLDLVLSEHEGKVHGDGSFRTMGISVSGTLVYPHVSLTWSMGSIQGVRLQMNFSGQFLGPDSVKGYLRWWLKGQNEIMETLVRN